MKSILIVSPHFPTPDIYSDISKDPRSKFLFNYAMQWKSQGHLVTVVHPIQKFPRLLNLAIKLVSKFNPNYSRFIQDEKTTTCATFNFQGIDIIRRPLIKLIPHFKISSDRIFKLSNELNREPCFTCKNYDLVLLDYLSPSLDLFGKLNFTSKVKVYTIFHQTDEKYLKKNLYHYKKILDKCTGLVFRNKTASLSFTREFELSNKSYLMYSGIPMNQTLGSKRKNIRNFLFVGRVIESKNIQDIIYAISFLPDNVKGNINFEIVGDGEYKNNLKSLVADLNLSDIVFFTPKVPHSVVFEKMNKCDVFVMVSKETFGMVYVEALSQGCVVIAAKGEGIDGIIKNKVNGFLVSLGNRNELSDLIIFLFNSEEIVIQKVTENALITANNMKDDYLAYQLIDKLV